jgi:hypothetical protein
MISKLSVFFALNILGTITATVVLKFVKQLIKIFISVFDKVAITFFEAHLRGISLELECSYLFEMAYDEINLRLRK